MKLNEVWVSEYEWKILCKRISPVRCSEGFFFSLGLSLPLCFLFNSPNPFSLFGSLLPGTGSSVWGRQPVHRDHQQAPEEPGHPHPVHDQGVQSLWDARSYSPGGIMCVCVVNICFYCFVVWSKIWAELNFNSCANNKNNLWWFNGALCVWMSGEPYW